MKLNYLQDIMLGVDIPAGIYDITAIKGTGNVSSSNMYDGESIR
ncbi:hypothetical protein [Leptotrichia wadei]|nr:hypothetical protein [Leptotrichia wadei]